MHAAIRRYLCVGATIAGIVAAAPAARAVAPSAAGFYDGHFTAAPAGTLHVASAVLNQTKKTIDGTVTIADGGAATREFSLTGRARGRRVVLAGTDAAGVLLKWRGKWTSDDSVVGKAKRRAIDGAVTRGALTLVRRSAPPDACDTYFRDALMAQVFVPICVQCHVAGGLAELSRLRVSVDDTAATRQSVAGLVDVADPAASTLLQKPIGGLGHGGGVQIAPDGPAHLLLKEWVARVSSGECVTAVGGGPGGPGGGGTGADVYGANCASCHGADARGLDGRPDIHCSKNVAPIVRTGRTGAIGEMPAFPSLSDADIQAVQTFLDGLCPAGAATGAELFAGNCASCHGVTGSGGRNGVGVAGPDIRCKESHDFVEKVTYGDDEMPAFPELGQVAIDKLVFYANGFCPDGGDDD